MQECICYKQLLPEVVAIERKKAELDYEKAGIIAKHEMKKTLEQAKDMDEENRKQVKVLADKEYEIARIKAD